jgi:hypothetical protein
MIICNAYGIHANPRGEQKGDHVPRLVKRSEAAQRIVHVGSFGFKPVKNFLNGTAGKLSNGFIRAGHNVMNFSDRDIARWAGWFGYRNLGGWALREALYNYCKAARPDVLLLGHADLIDNETVLRIREAVQGIRVVQWNVDWLAGPGQAVEGDHTAASNSNKIVGKDPVVDVTLVTSGGLGLKRLASRMKSRVAFMPNVVDPSVERARAFEQPELPNTVFYASSSQDRQRHHAGAWRDIGDMVHDMRRAVPDAVIRAYGFDGLPTVFGPAIQDAMAGSRIGLNISRRNDLFLYSSDRMAQMVGNGLAICIDRACGFDTIFGEDEMVFYRTELELFDAVARMTADDNLRREIGRRGWERYQALFRTDVVAKYILDLAFDEHDPRDYVWPTTADRHPDR